MPIGGRADTAGHPKGTPGLPATLAGALPNLSAPSPDPGQLGNGPLDVRRVPLQALMEPWDHVGVAVPMAHLAGPQIGSYVVERAMVAIEQSSALWVLIGPVGDRSIRRAVDYVDNYAPDGEPAPHLWAIAESPQPWRVLPGEELTFVWITNYEHDCWAHLQVRAER